MSNEPTTLRSLFAGNRIQSNLNTTSNFRSKNDRKKTFSETEFRQKTKRSHNNGTYLKSLKIDISSIRQCIADLSGILKFYKNPRITDLNRHFMQRINQIEVLKDDYDPSAQIDIDEMVDEFECKTQKELIYFLYESHKITHTFLNKLSDYALLLNLNYNNPKFSFADSYKENYSKFNYLSKFINNMIERNGELKEKVDMNADKRFQQHLETLSIDPQPCHEFSATINFNRMSSSLEFGEENRMEVGDYYNQHFADISRNGIRRSSTKESAGIFNPYGVKKSTKDILQVKKQNEKISANLPSAREHTIYSSRMISEPNVPEENIVNELESQIKERDQELVILRRVIQDLQNRPAIDEKAKKKLIEENAEILRRNSDLQSKMTTFKIEIDNLKKTNENLERNFRKGKTSPEEFEQMQKDSFNEMRMSFVKKIGELESEISGMRNEYNKTILHLRSDLQQSKGLNEMFIKVKNDYFK